MTVQMLCYIAVMAGTTYLIRALPMLLVRKKIKNRFVQSFLYYVPYAVLAAMTVPAILESTASAAWVSPWSLRTSARRSPIILITSFWTIKSIRFLVTLTIY